MESNDFYWMKRSIEISKKNRDNVLKVGAILVSDKNEELCSSVTVKEGFGWSQILLEKIKEKKISKVHKAYITINTMSENNQFDMNGLLEIVQIESIYIGLPDPSLLTYKNDDPILLHNRVYRFTDELQREIIEQNVSFFKNSKQNINNSPYYSDNRISKLILNGLRSKGIPITKEEIKINKRESSLIDLLCTKYEIDHSEAIIIVSETLSNAFDKKYGCYDYLHDTRSIKTDWKQNFKKFYRQNTNKSMVTASILNVGVGSGNEAVSLFSECKDITFVDIAKGGINKVKRFFPFAKACVSSADNLETIPDKSVDIYISLRTYNSSFFNIQYALSEAKRVLKSQSTLLISIANGFLCPEYKFIISGLIIPGTDFVDLYRSMETVRIIAYELRRMNFKEIQIFPTNTEIYLAATLN